MYKLGSLSKVVLGALTLTLSSSLWANSDASQVDKQQQIKEFKQNSVAELPDQRINGVAGQEAAPAAPAVKKRAKITNKIHTHRNGVSG